ncbi:MAG: AMP-binding protein, partial [Opitutales bacterium]|nr:AMP-binding protein [Opitutales bacterium]
MSENLTQIIKQYATATPSIDAVIEVRRHRQHAVIRRRLCYGEFDRRIDQYVSKFQKKGISAGKRVLMLLKPGIEMMCAFFALIRMGAIPILIDSG